MKTTNLSSDDETIAFLSDFCEFDPNRLYILSAMARPKENETISHSSIPMFREIITNEEKLRQKYYRLKVLAQNYTPEEGGSLTFRLYITPNARDTEKSMYIFQKQLIDMQKQIASGHETTREKIKRLDKEWESTLQTDGNKDDNYFIIDIDEESEELFERAWKSLEENTDILHATETPNGYHIITEPFNYPDWEGLSWEGEIEIKTDGLTFIRML